MKAKDSRGDGGLRYALSALCIAVSSCNANIEMPKGSAYDELAQPLSGPLAASAAIAVPSIAVTAETGLHFDGVKDTLFLQDARKTEFGVGDFTLAVWVKVDERSQGEFTIVGKGAGGRRRAGYRLGLDRGQVRFELRDGRAMYRVKARGPLQLGAWHHIVATRRGAELALFIDARLAGERSLPNSFSVNTGAPFVVGATVDSRRRFFGRPRRLFRGGIDELVILASGVAERDVQELREFAVTPQLQPALVGSYSFTGGSLRELSGEGPSFSMRSAPRLISGARPVGPDRVLLSDVYRVPTAMQFDGEGHLSVPPAAAFDIGSSDFTLSVSTRPNADAAGLQFLAGSGASGSRGYRLLLKDGVPIFEVRSGRLKSRITSPVSLEAERWHRIVGVRRAGVLSLYVDGYRVAKRRLRRRSRVSRARWASPAPAQEAVSFSIGGARNFRGVQGFRGQLDSVSLYRKALPAPALALLGGAMPAFDEPSLLGFWPLDSSPARDLSGHGFDATSELSRPKVLGTSQRSAALSFNGVGDQVHAPIAAANVGNGEFTISGFVKLETESQAGQVLVGKGMTEPSGVGYRVTETHGRLSVEIDDGSGRVTSAQPTQAASTADGAWHHFAAVRADSELRLYVDGVFQSRQALAGELDLNTPKALIIGAKGGAGFFAGQLDAIAVHGRALSLSEIEMMGQFGAAPADPTLLVYYSLDHGRAYDSSPYGHHASLLGEPEQVAGVTLHGHTRMQSVAERSRYKGWYKLPAGGSLVATLENSLSVEDLRGRPLDSNPPQVRPHAPFPESEASAYPEGQKPPYNAEGIQPFRLSHFATAISYGGKGMSGLQAYASSHGFASLSELGPEAEYLPSGTQFHQRKLKVANEWMLTRDINTFAEVPSAAKVQEAFDLPESPTAYAAGYGSLVLALERSVPGADAEPAEQEGFLNFALGILRSAKSAGWPAVGLYGWSPFKREFWNVGGFPLTGLPLDTVSNWESYGEAIAEVVDVYNPSVHMFYHSHQNVAYALANVDMVIRTLAQRSDLEPKPVIPDYWNQLHGGGNGTRWWRHQPVRDEDLRAVAFLNFFTGAQGLSLWGSSESGQSTGEPLNAHEARPMAAGLAYSVGVPFTALSADGSVSKEVTRYDALYITSYDASSDVARYQVIARTPVGNNAFGEVAATHRLDADWSVSPVVSDDGSYQYPVYQSLGADLRASARAPSSNVGAFIEGLALAKWVEGALRFGVPREDIAMSEQYSSSLAISRRVEFGPYQLIGTYNPMFEHSSAVVKQVQLTDFDGAIGHNLELPADSQTRLFILYPQP